MSELMARPAGASAVHPEGPATVVRLVGEIDGALRDQASHGMGLALFAGQESSEAELLHSAGKAK